MGFDPLGEVNTEGPRQAGGVGVDMGEVLESGRTGGVSYPWYLPTHWFPHYSVRGELCSENSREGWRELGGRGEPGR